MNNQKYKTRPQAVNINGDEPVFFPFGIKTSKCSGNCNNINDQYAKICVPNVIKKLKRKCECDKACDVSEYLDYENCKYRKKSVDKLFDE